MPTPRRGRRAILEVVEDQLRTNSPPNTQPTLDRLLAVGYSRQAAVASEIWHILHEQQPYDQ